MKKIRVIILLAFVIMPMLSDAQTFDWLKAVKNVFKCSPSISKSLGGIADFGHDYDAYDGVGCIDWGYDKDPEFKPFGVCRFGNLKKCK